ncbi:hypothetical protein QE152_g22682 [Popillia japonica]|uniref:Uncharacterized protein n=1 Tax=Popillia japonica TaxID=7064 RepID=A0AAW1KL41_POPJA
MVHSVALLLLLLCLHTEADNENNIPRYEYIQRIIANGHNYTGTIIDFHMVVSDVETKSKDTKVCKIDNQNNCSDPQKINIIDDVAYIKVSEAMPLPPFSDDSLENCQAIGITHEEVNITISDDVVNCEGCSDFDAVICEDSLVGILRGKDEYNFVNIQILRDIGVDVVHVDQRRSEADDDDWLSINGSVEDKRRSTYVYLCPIVVVLFGM